MTIPADWIELAVVTQPHGVRGQVKIKSFCDPEDGFADYPELTDASGARVKLRITGEAQGQFIATIEGLTDRNAAERWRGRKLGVPQSALPALPADSSFYVAELVGMEVVDGAAAPIGTVRAVENFGAGDLIDILRADGSSDYYTFTEANFPAIDREARRLTFTPPSLLGSKAEEEGTA